MTLEDLKKSTKDKLLTLAKKYKIKKPSALKKSELIDKISKFLKPTKEVPKKGAPKTKIEQEENFLSESKEKIEATKFYMGPSIEKREEEFNFPSGYGDHKIIAMVRDPWWLYAYWEISHQEENRVIELIRKRGASPQKSVLRVYDITDINFNGSNAHSYFDIELKGLASNWYINVGKPNRAWVIEIGIIASNGEFYRLARSNYVKTPRFGMSEIMDEEWMCLDEDYWKMFGLSGGFGVGKSSMAFKELMQKRLLEAITSGSVSSISSPVKKISKQKSFWLIVDCELIVYGATEPDANVSIQGKPIKLRNDGTFTMRFALPDGKQVIPVVATNKDGDDTKSVTPTVIRTTEYKNQ